MHPKIIILHRRLYRTIDIGQDQAENRENQRSRRDLSSKSRVKLNISLVKTLTAVADRPTVYVSVTPPCKVPQLSPPFLFCDVIADKALHVTFGSIAITFPYFPLRMQNSKFKHVIYLPSKQ